MFQSSTPPLLLLDCLHPSAFTYDSSSNSSGDLPSDAVDPQRCLRTVLRILTNHHEHPTDTRFASFSAVSAVWQRDVCPCVYVLRLVRWMGCTPDTEGARYVFATSSSGSSAEHHQRLCDCVDEVRCVKAVWASSVVALSGASAPNEDNKEVQGKEEMRWKAAREALRRLYAAAAAAPNASPAAHEEATVSITRALQVGLLSHAAGVLAEHTPSAQPSTSPSSSDASASCAAWVRRLPSSLRRFVGFDESSSCSSPPSPCTGVEEVLLWLLHHATLCQLTLECNTAARDVAVAINSSSSSGSDGSVSPSTSSVLAERFRRQAQSEQHERYLNSTGPAYRRLSHEERHRGESVVIDIAGLLEQLAVVRETQGMVRTDRQEARRLLEAFRHDGDLVALYALQEQYTEELEEAKRLYEKPLVYADQE